MSKKNTGPCSIKNCIYLGHFFHRITEFAYQKCEKENMLEVYSYLNIGGQLCYQYYCQIVESKRNKQFFLSIINAIILKERSTYNKQEAKKSILALCYMIASLHNKFVNQFKTEVGLYLAVSRTTWKAIDIISSLGYSIYVKSVANYQKKIQKNYIIKIESYFSKNGNFLHIYNINNFYDIHEKKRPDTTLTLIANHFSICVTKPVIDCLKILLIFNGISVHNPNNIEAWRICWYLLNKYTGIFDITYIEYQLQGYQDNQNFNQIELLTVSRSVVPIKGNQSKGRNGKNICDAGSVWEDINTADWPGQLFLRKALALRSQLNIPQEIEFFLPILRSLHLSLNSRKHIILIYHNFFEQMFHSVFGNNKKLAKKPKP
ncbi:hypothetical protein Glove_566g83 [Diversispora epigaea]|uniref:Uncharacterized protein n=1 Tax=Diversispora epigaea TaxID=1348612 RepID=A0A397GA19_9GLOM|nr:hypothetical protein Glove_566g83 [Diversispora epigaea]